MSTSPKRLRTVAVVEDDPAMLSGLKRMLDAFGYAVETFASAEAFLARSADMDCACLVADINLKGISGIEMRRRLAANGMEIPVIFITARDDEATLREAADVGYAAFLRKPFSGQVLIDAIERAAYI